MLNKLIKTKSRHLFPTTVLLISWFWLVKSDDSFFLTAAKRPVRLPNHRFAAYEVQKCTCVNMCKDDLKMNLKLSNEKKWREWITAQACHLSGKHVGYWWAHITHLYCIMSLVQISKANDFSTLDISQIQTLLKRKVPQKIAKKRFSGLVVGE